MSTPATGRDGAAPDRGFTGELRDAVTLRRLILVVGVLVLQLAFILSYNGAFHSPTPHRIPVAVVAPAQAAGTVAAQLNALEGGPFQAPTTPSEQRARRLILDRTVDAAIIVNAGGTDTLLVASASGPAVFSTTQQIAAGIE
ncbi:hypothetical protein ABZ806_26005 [Spirillospora sp. NPDC047418]|jgi:hypothetical protein